MPEINIYAQKVPKVLVGTKSDLLQNEKKTEKKNKKLQNTETDRTVKHKEVDSVQGSTHCPKQRTGSVRLCPDRTESGHQIPGSVMKDYGFHSFNTCSSINQVKYFNSIHILSIYYFSQI